MSVSRWLYDWRSARAYGRAVKRGRRAAIRARKSGALDNAPHRTYRPAGNEEPK